MKRIIRILVLAVALVTGLTTVSAQKVQVVLIQKVPALPATVISYVDDPFRYFDIRFIVMDAGSEGIDIFFDMNLTVNTSPLYVRTRPGTIPLEPIHLSNGVNKMKSDELNHQVLGRTETNFDYSNLLDAQQLPEGTYELCVDFYLWSDRLNPERIPITIGPCPTFDICYSGSAPELVSPMAGAQLTMKGDLVVKPNRKINFLWTPVISNCSGRKTRIKYKLKVVKVLKGQNYQDAIKRNPTVLSTEVRDNNYAIFDTLRDIKVQMERGKLYVAQVSAEQIKTKDTEDTFIIANDGNSQPMPFFWDYYDKPIGSSPEIYNPNIFSPKIPGVTMDNNNTQGKSSGVYGYSVDDESEEGDENEGVEGLTVWEGGEEEVSELETIQDRIKEQYLTGFIQDAATVAQLTRTYPDERQYVPTPKRHYVESDGYYTVPTTDDLEVSFMPARHNSLKNVSYAIELYNYIKGADIDSITSYEPLLKEKIEEVPESYNKMDSHQLITRKLDGWGAKLEQGNRYYLQLSRSYTVGYWKYSVADTNFYVNEQLAEHVHDTVSRNFVEEEFNHSNGVFFQWGDNPVPASTTPQWKAPVDRTGDDIYDPMNYKLPTSIPEIKRGTFPVSWTPVKNLAKEDKAEYEVNVYELKPNQTLEEAISENKLLVTRTVTNANEISDSDTKFFKVFSPQKTYIMTLSTSVSGDSDTIYHFENGNKALPVIIKIVK